MYSLFQSRIKHFSFKTATFNLIIVSLIAILLSLLTQCSNIKADNIKSKNEFKTEERGLETFNGIDISGSFNISIAEAQKQQVLISANESVLKNISTEVKGKTLYIKTKNDLNNHGKIDISICYESLNSLSIRGASDVKGLKKISSNSFDIDLSGSNNINLDFEVLKLDVDISGANDAILTGSAENCEFELSGVSDLDAVSLKTTKSKIVISGSGEAKINVNDELIIDASGVSNVFYKGNPEKKTINTKGLSTVKEI